MKKTTARKDYHLFIRVNGKFQKVDDFETWDAADASRQSYIQQGIETGITCH